MNDQEAGILKVFLIANVGDIDILGAARQSFAAVVAGRREMYGAFGFIAVTRALDVFTKENSLELTFHSISCCSWLWFLVASLQLVNEITLTLYFLFLFFYFFKF